MNASALCGPSGYFRLNVSTPFTVVVVGLLAVPVTVPGLTRYPPRRRRGLRAARPGVCGARCCASSGWRRRSALPAALPDRGRHVGITGTCECAARQILRGHPLRQHAAPNQRTLTREQTQLSRRPRRPHLLRRAAGSALSRCGATSLGTVLARSGARIPVRCKAIG